jgi:hypothetical protein
VKSLGGGAGRNAVLAEFRERVGGFEIAILQCRRECPRSSLGRFGWDTDEGEMEYRWWDTVGRANR